jgi:UDP-N-acetylmuramoyl-tripeptide--D-alanyl-D-alanine ligase
VDAIADAKAEIFAGLEPDGTAVINRDNGQYARLRRHAQTGGVARIVTFGEHSEADARLVNCALRADDSTVRAHILGADVTYTLGAPGRHQVMNSLAVLAAAALAGADLARAARALADVKPATGRGTRTILHWDGQSALLIDESYNANPASMRAALALLGQTPATGRRIAVLGDMLELGPAGADLHRDLAGAVTENGIDLVFCCGPLMRALWDALPSARRGGYADTSAALEPDVLSAIRPGDVLMVKGSLGSRMAPIVKAIQHQFSRQAAPAQG